MKYLVIDPYRTVKQLITKKYELCHSFRLMFVLTGQWSTCGCLGRDASVCIWPVISAGRHTLPYALTCPLPWCTLSHSTCHSSHSQTCHCRVLPQSCSLVRIQLSVISISYSVYCLRTCFCLQSFVCKRCYVYYLNLFILWLCSCKSAVLLVKTSFVVLLYFI